jgi:hypothetical protein
MGVFAKFWGSNDFWDLWNYFMLEKSIEYVHNSVDWVHPRYLTGLWTSWNAGRWLLDWWLRLNQANWYLGCSSTIWRLMRLAPAGCGARSRLRRRIAAERGGSPELEFSWATVVGFWWGLLLWDHNDEGNVFMLTLTSGERQRSPAMVRRLGRCLSTVRAASGEALAQRTCAKDSLSSLLASRPTNCSNQWQKTRIWWPPRVQLVLDLRQKIHTICGAIYRGF